MQGIALPRLTSFGRCGVSGHPECIDVAVISPPGAEWRPIHPFAD